MKFGIAMFSGPRDNTTMMMRTFENRHDTTVFDEPFEEQAIALSAA